VLVSLVGQLALIGVALVIPLLYTLEIPIADLTNRILLVAPTPPPPPAPEPRQRTAAPAPKPPTRFETQLKAPREIPEEIAIVNDVENSATIPGKGLGGLTGGVPGGIPGGVLSLVGHGSMSVLPPVPIRVGGNVQAARLTNRVLPVYPDEASEERLEGTVKLEATVTREGTIRELRVIEGHPLLAEAAMAAVRQWIYRPTLLNGSPVEVLTLVTISFHARELTPKEEKQLRKRKRKRKAANQ